MGNDGVGTGFSAHPEKLGDAGDRLITASGDVGGIKGTLDKLNMSDPATFGEYAGDGAKAFWSAWQDELQVNIDALSDLGGKVHTTVANYAKADHGVQQQYQQGA
ncbi:WXG100 family type VII secretion target [Kitasatospora sp. NPDC059146]|uniref:WXG100 family type VII secretion target n=1 Tax=Kitasatospora sp. NPDC059146 TaxID=3346741 RepID=UPI0036A515F1